MKALASLTMVLFVLSPALGVAQSTCTATNENGTQTCTATCSVGQTAQCSQGTGSSAPECGCTDGGNQIQSLGKIRRSLSGMHNFRGATTPVPISQEDVAATINQYLAKLRDYKLGQVCQSEQIDEVCHIDCPPRACQFVPGPVHVDTIECYPKYGNVCHEVSGKLTVNPKTISVIGNPVVNYSPPPLAGVPEDSYVLSKAYRNCTAQSQTEGFQHTATVTASQSITKTKTLTDSVGISIAMSGSFSFMGAGASNTNTITLNHSTAITNTDQETKTQSISYTDNPGWTIGPMTDSTLVHTFNQFKIDIPFNGTVVVDASINSNDEGVKTLSVVVPSVTSRTFDFAGVISDSTLIGSTTFTDSHPLLASDCAKVGVFPISPSQTLGSPTIIPNAGPLAHATAKTPRKH